MFKCVLFIYRDSFGVQFSKNKFSPLKVVIQIQDGTRGDTFMSAVSLW